MASPCCLTDPGAHLVIDSSAAINLTATGCSAMIVNALPNKVVAVDTILVELEIGRRKGRPHADSFQRLVDSGLIQIVSLDDAAESLFEDLVIGPAAKTLDDGEAATLAFSANVGATPIIDERKAKRICEEKFPRLSIGSSVDLFAHVDVQAVLGRTMLSEAVQKALAEARMRVLPHHVDWVVELIGRENAASCKSLSRHVRGAISRKT